LIQQTQQAMTNQNINRSQIFRNAWSVVRAKGITISKALKWAWGVAKSAANGIDASKSIIKESEKAVCIAAVAVNHGRNNARINFDMWTPKSVLVNGMVPMSWIEKKVAELATRFGQSSVTFGFEGLRII
jgi:hypothetical protein